MCIRDSLPGSEEGVCFAAQGVAGDVQPLVAFVPEEPCQSAHPDHFLTGLAGARKNESNRKKSLVWLVR
jgi:hypothetical protein